MTKEEIDKEIENCTKEFIGQPATRFSTENLKATLNRQLLDFFSKNGINNIPPIPQVEIEGTVANISFINPATGKTMNRQEMYEWINGKCLF